jgi:hypothetical protein
MANTTSTVETELRDFAASRSLSRVGKTIAALLRSDSGRLQFWDGSSTVQHVAVQNTYNGDEELTTMYAAERYANMRACVGWIAIDGYPMQSGAWLTLNGSVIDPAGAGRDALGFLGVQLKATEAALWTPTQRHAVAESRVSGFAL